MNIKECVKKKAEEAKVKADIFWWKTKEWVKQDPKQAELVVALVIGTGGVILKEIFSAAKIHREQRLKDLYVYDHSIGRYWLLKRKLTAGEQIAIEQMRKAGMGYGEIFTKLKLL